MTRRERLRRCYFHEELDRPGIYSRAGFPSDDPTYDKLKAYLDERTELKRSWAPKYPPAWPIETQNEPYSDEFQRIIHRVRTPQGDLTATRLASLKGQPGLHETFFIKSREDAERYLSLPIPEHTADVAPFFEVDRQIGERGIAEMSLGFNPAGFVAELCGSETFAILSITDRDIVHALCERQMNLMLARAKFLVANRVGPYFAMLGEEYLVPPLAGPTDFHDFNVRYDKPIIDLVHEAGGRVHVHSHGAIRKVFQGFLDMGVDVLHPFEPPPMGDITAPEAKALARGRLCLEGNIQIAAMYESTPAKIRDETTALIRAAFDDRKGLIVCPTASPYIRGQGEVCFPQYKAMIDTVLEWA
ncbi:MAG: hypothetical protein KKB50_19285 [Planctomycetes bacterium]|nr:hypothetical protein [Planctomycetota bacterium]